MKRAFTTATSTTAPKLAKDEEASLPVAAGGSETLGVAPAAVDSAAPVVPAGGGYVGLALGVYITDMVLAGAGAASLLIIGASVVMAVMQS